MQLSRRNLLAASGIFILPSACTGLSNSEGGAPVVDTAYGRVRGYEQRGVKVFKAIPYGDTTTGVNRFMSPRPPQPWTGVKDCLAYGPQTPQGNGLPAPEQQTPYTRLYAGRPEEQSEDSLILNIWTPALDNAKRPVFFWIHGGGFSTGSGASPWYDGTNVARKQDVVVVTINHRLNVFGYAHLGAFSEQFADSSNNGTLDCIAALKWVRDNIERFGGDPNRVMVHGQSGGGRKTTMVLTTTPAQGLFHRAVVQSGSQLRVDTHETGEAKAKRLLDALQINPRDVRKLQDVPLLDIQKVQGAAAGAGAQWMPVAGTPSLPTHPFDHAASALSRNIPVMIGTCRTEQSGFLANDTAMDNLSDADLVQRLGRVEPGHGSELYALYKRLYPKRGNDEIYYQAATDRSYFLDSTIQAALRSDTVGAPTWMYIFNRETPVDRGRYYAPHAEEIPFVFDSLANGAVIAGPVTEESQLLADRVSALWASFARTGVPSASGMPQWTPYNSATRPTLMINNESRMANDPRSEERQTMLSFGSQQEAYGRAR